MPPGYHGRYLRIDLTARAAQPVELRAEILRRFIGGTGLGTWLLQRETPEEVDPLAPEAPLAFVFSPLVGSPLTTSAKFAVMCKSPLTGRINDSLSSSHFAIAGKKTGYDALVIVGAAEKPTCLVIDSEGVRFEDAAAAWGRPIDDSAAWLRSRIGPQYRTAVIGPAGENLVRFATVSHDRRHAGRGGTGAVMGAKKLKAVAVRGETLPRFARPQDLVRYSRELSRKSFGPATAKYRELGTVSNLLTLNRLGSLPTRNFQSGSFENAEGLALETERSPASSEKPGFSNSALDSRSESSTLPIVRTRDSCAACTIGCEHIFHLSAEGSPASSEKPGFSGVPETGVRMEYENLFALGPLCGVSDPQIVLRASQLCDRLGMDTISAGGTIAFAMECAERGLIDAPSLRFGNGRALLETLADIAARRGLGGLLADGSRAAAAVIGRGAGEFAPHVKGLEIPGYEPRTLQSMALGFAVGARGADHNRSGAYQVDLSEAVDRFHVRPQDVRHAIETENEAAIMDSLILCKFLRGVFDDKMAAMAEMLNLVTGWDVTAGELLETAGRMVTAKKLYNIRQGWTPEEDTLPRRFLNESLADESGRGIALTEERLRALIAAYNLARGWTREGWVTSDDLAPFELAATSL